MKKFLSMLLASVMVLSLLAGCGGGNNQKDNQGATPPQQNDNQTPTEPAEPPPETPDDVTNQVAAQATGDEAA